MTKEIILTVSEISSAIKFSLEKTFPAITVQGEVSNFKKQSSGHLYFSLKDETAQISCVMFKGDAIGLSKPFKDGDSLIIKGSLNVYPAGGRYQILVKEVKLAGIGELLLKLEELKTKIRDKGWFDKKYKKPLPKYPKTIGIVTSPTGAVIQDILNILRRRFSGLHIILNPVKVQGPGAALEIAAAIRQFNAYKLADVLIVGRGGGSIEDLFCFNEEVVAEAIFSSEIPIICAVGHETDHCIAEYVADQRAPTPSAAAEIIIPEKRELQESLKKVQKNLHASLKKQLSHVRIQLDYFAKSPLFKDPYALIGLKAQKLDDFKDILSEKMSQILKQKRLLLKHCHEKLDKEKPTVKLSLRKQKLHFFAQTIKKAISNKSLSYRQKIRAETTMLKKLIRTKIAREKSRFDPVWEKRNLDSSIKRLIINRNQRLSHLGELISSANPKNLLNRGYSILFSEKDHSVIKSVERLSSERTFTVMLSDGEAAATFSHILSDNTYDQATHL